MRVGAFMGKKIWNGAVNLGSAVSEPKVVAHLTELAPSEVEWAALHADAGQPFPASLTGAAFLAAHGGHDDPVTAVDPGRTYAIRDCANHPINEHARVTAYEQLMRLDAARRPWTSSLVLPNHAFIYDCSASNCRGRFAPPNASAGHGHPPASRRADAPGPSLIQARRQPRIARAAPPPLDAVGFILFYLGL